MKLGMELHQFISKKKRHTTTLKAGMQGFQSHFRSQAAEPEAQESSDKSRRSKEESLE